MEMSRTKQPKNKSIYLQLTDLCQEHRMNTGWFVSSPNAVEKTIIMCRKMKSEPHTIYKNQLATDWTLKYTIWSVKLLEENREEPSWY